MLNRKELKFFSSVSPLYGLTLLFVALGIKPYLPEVKTMAYIQNPASIQYHTASNVKKTEPKVVISGTPSVINIPRLELTKNILPGKYDPATGTWNVSDLDVHYAELSSPPNDNKGNTLLYAHNNKWAFGPLYLMQQNDIVEITTNNGYKFSYKFISADDYDPTDTSLFSYGGTPKLILQTCSGYFNEYRRLYNFDFVSVEKI